MDTLKCVLVSAGLLVIATNGNAAPASGLLFDQLACSSNCVQSLRSVNNLIVVAKNGDGAVFKTLSFAMPGEARLLYAGGGAARRQVAPDSAVFAAGASTDEAAMQCANMPGLCTASSVRTYVTPGFYIFYTYTFVFSNGNLMEISVEESRTTRDFVD